MAEESPEVVQPVPDWGIKVLQTAVREYRYTGDYLPPGREEDVLVGIRRGDTPVGRIRLRHTMKGPRHLLHLSFESKDGKVEERFVVRSLKQLQQYTGFLLERVCRYGATLRPNWCEDCSQRERHLQGQYRGLAQPLEAPQERGEASDAP